MDGPSPELCKVIASAVALGYPLPTIVNWKKDDLHVNPDESIPSHLLKITGVLDFLQWATNSSTPQQNSLDDDDLVLIMDAHDVWLQLPPEVLIERYFSANARANMRLEDKFYDCGETIPQQSILISAQKRCVGPHNTVSDLHCQNLPESPLPNDIYGMFTDSRLIKSEYRRPKYLNSGSFIGPAGDLRRYFSRVKDRMDRHLRSPFVELWGDQGIFAEIFGEQEIWRDVLVASPGEVDAAEEFEYGVGLDYFQELFYPTCGSEHSGSFIRMDDSHGLKRESARAGVAPLRLQELPYDISTAQSPLQELDVETSWDSVPLFADLWTTSIPVGIHHNAFAHGLKSRQQKWWDRTWYFPYLRELIEMRMAGNDSEAVAEISSIDGKLDVLSYTTGMQEGSEAALLYAKKGRDQDLRRAGWDEVCMSDDDYSGLWWEEVLRDGKGSIRE